MEIEKNKNEDDKQEQDRLEKLAQDGSDAEDSLARVEERIISFSSDHQLDYHAIEKMVVCYCVYIKAVSKIQEDKKRKELIDILVYMLRINRNNLDIQKNPAQDPNNDHRFADRMRKEAATQNPILSAKYG